MKSIKFFGVYQSKQKNKFYNLRKERNALNTRFLLHFVNRDLLILDKKKENKNEYEEIIATG